MEYILALYIILVLAAALLHSLKPSPPPREPTEPLSDEELAYRELLDRSL